MRLGRDEVPAEAHRVRVLSKLGDGCGRAGTDRDIRALLGRHRFPLLEGRRGRQGLGFYQGQAAAGSCGELRGFGALDPRVRGQ